MDPNSEAITLKSLAKVANDLGETMSEEMIQMILAESDKDGDGMLSFEEFVRVIKKTTPQVE
jgi:centrin-1